MEEVCIIPCVNWVPLTYSFRQVQWYISQVSWASSADLFCYPICAGSPKRGGTINEFVFSEMHSGSDNQYSTLLVLVSGWSDNGWLSGGHAVRMAMELCPSSFCVHCLLFKSKMTYSNAQSVAKTSKAHECQQIGCRWSAACDRFKDMVLSVPVWTSVCLISPILPILLVI